MPDSTTIPLIFAIAIPNMFLYSFLDRLMKQRTDEIATGVVQGVSVTIAHRWLLVHTSWLLAVAASIGSQSVFSIGYWQLSRNTNVQEIRMFAELYTFFSVVGVVAWMYVSIVWYVRFRSILRRAEQH